MAWRGCAGLLAALCVMWVANSAQAARPGTSSAPTTADLMQCLAKKAPEEGLRYTIRMTRVGRGDERSSLQLRLASEKRDDERRVHIQAISPPDVAGMSYLVISSPEAHRVYAYMPSTGRPMAVREGQEIPLFGSDLNTGMLLRLLSDLREQSITGAGTLERDGRTLRKLYITSLAATSFDQTVRILVDVDRCELAEVLLEAHGKPDMRATLDAGLFSATPERGSEVIVEALRSGSQTELRLEAVDPSGSVDRRVFDPKTFYPH